MFEKGDASDVPLSSQPTIQEATQYMYGTCDPAVDRSYWHVEFLGNVPWKQILEVPQENHGSVGFSKLMHCGDDLPMRLQTLH